MTDGKCAENFFFIKTKIFDLQYIQINFLRLKQRTKICATVMLYRTDFSPDFSTAIPTRSLHIVVRREIR